MKVKIFIMAIIIIGVGGFILSQNIRSDNSSIEKVQATVYKSSTCGCCGVYTAYMKKNHYNVKIQNTEDMSAIKRQFSVPYELESCHTTEVDGYVIEGHVPNEAIQKLLSERPDIKGIGMAGMPSGSPGMPGLKSEDFVIYEITQQGERGEIFMTI